MSERVYDSSIVGTTPGVASPPSLRSNAHRFYLWGSIAAFAVVFAGFSRTYYLKTLFGTPALPWLLHLHGALMTSWFVLFVVQTRLVAARRIRVHRRLGVFGGVLVVLIVIVGVAVALRFGVEHAHRGRALQFMGFVLFVLLVFAILVGTALLLRRRPDYHKRLMLLSCLSLVGPGLTRLPFEHVRFAAFLKTGGPLGLFGLDLLLVYACIAYDTWRNHRLHPAFVCGTLLMAFLDLPFISMFLSSPTWMRFASWLAS